MATSTCSPLGGSSRIYWLTDHYKSGSAFAAANLAAMGIPTNLIFAIEPDPVIRDRTYASAHAVAQWLKRQPRSSEQEAAGAQVSSTAPVRTVTVYSLGAHARRSRLLYQRALGRGFEVGVIAHPNMNYDARRWWASMDGFVDVSGEALAYLYAKFLFHPGTPPALSDSGGQQLVQ